MKSYSHFPKKQSSLKSIFLRNVLILSLKTLYPPWFNKHVAILVRQVKKIKLYWIKDKSISVLIILHDNCNEKQKGFVT
uniref:Uncharacterized protein n=1 Tax=Megaselia scalaris TaxID=36166 RepID=T1GMI3_MEGSC